MPEFLGRFAFAWMLFLYGGSNSYISLRSDYLREWKTALTPDVFMRADEFAGENSNQRNLSAGIAALVAKSLF